MKTNLFKTMLSLFAGLMITVYSCNKEPMNIANATTSSDNKGSLTSVSSMFNPTVGAPIDFSTGRQWIENFSRANGGSGKDYVLAYRDLKTILSQTGCVGICFYFAKDENNATHLLPVGINTKGGIMKTAFIPTQNGSISWETAQKWIANDFSPIDARFFGSNTFGRLFKAAKSTDVRAIWALDQENQAQLLLIDAAVNNILSGGWNSNLLFEDRSSPCPPICGISE